MMLLGISEIQKADNSTSLPPQPTELLFDPSLGEVTYWYADSGVISDSNGKISSWNYQGDRQSTSRSYNLIQSTQTQQPTLVENGLNNRAVINFDNTSLQELRCSFIQQESRQLTAYFLARSSAPSGSSNFATRYLFHCGLKRRSDGVYYSNTGDTTYSVQYSYDFIRDSFNGSSFSSTPLNFTDQDWVLIIFTMYPSGSNVGSRAYVGDVTRPALSTSESEANNYTSNTFLVFGAGSSKTTSSCFAGDIASAAFFYSTSHTVEQRQLVYDTFVDYYRAAII